MSEFWGKYLKSQETSKYAQNHALCYSVFKLDVSTHYCSIHYILGLKRSSAITVHIEITVTVGSFLNSRCLDKLQLNYNNHTRPSVLMRPLNVLLFNCAEQSNRCRLCKWISLHKAIQWECTVYLNKFTQGNTMRMYCVFE